MNPFREMFRQEFRAWPIALLAVSCVLCAGKAWGRADEKAGASARNPDASSQVIVDDRMRAAVAAGSVVAVRQPVAAYALFQAGTGFSLWSGLPESLEPESSKAPPLVNLESVKDSEHIRSGEECLAFCEALVK